MASGETESSTSYKSQYSLSMRMLLGTIRRQWPKVQNISTQTLHEWLVAQGDLETEKQVEERVPNRKIVILVRHIKCNSRFYTQSPLLRIFLTGKFLLIYMVKKSKVWNIWDVCRVQNNLNSTKLVP